MNKSELNSVFAELEPTNIQKSKMLESIINTKEISSKKYFGNSKVLKFAAAFVLILCLSGKTAYATGLLDNIVGHFKIGNSFVSWVNNDDLLSGNGDIQDATGMNYSKIYTYKDVDAALKKHHINIALPKSDLLSEDLSGVTIKISNNNPDIEITNFQGNYIMGNGMVLLNIDCYKIASNTNIDLELGISTSQHADIASKYIAKTGATFTLLKSDINKKSQTVANIMIKDNKQVYLYSIKFTDESDANIENMLDSFDFSIYTAK